MNISKSLYCNYVQCPKMIWLLKNKKEEYVETKKDSIMENGNEVGDLARKYFGNYSLVKFNEVLINMIMDTKKLIKQNKSVICEASFKFDNLFASIDILKIDEDGMSIYEVKSSTEVKDIYIDDASFQSYILRKLGYNIKSVNIMHLNGNYELDKELDLKKLFNIVDITDLSISKEKEIEENVKEINEILNDEIEPNIDLDIHCFKPYDCPFFKYCSKHLPINNVFKIRNMTVNKKIKLYKEGKVSFNDLIKEDLNEKYLEQIDFEINNRDPKINIDKIKEFLNTLKKPIYFLDFETFQDAVPRYQKQRVYSQVPFQYSLHYYDENNNLKHKEFLSEDNVDPRKEVAINLVKDIPTNVDVLAYNMSFEKSVIKNLARIYPELSDKLMKIHDNIKDLMIPFYNRDYYVKEMDGSYSIKYVLPALFKGDESLDYHNLELVHNGSEAMETFKKLSDMDTIAKEKVRKALLKYCELDTYAMVKIYEKLISLS